MRSSTFTRVAVNRALGIYYKQFLPRSPWESLKSLVRGSRAQRARRNGDALLFAGIDAPVNIFWGRHHKSGEYLFTAAAPGKGVTSWLRDNPAGCDAAQLRLRRQLLRELGVFVGRVHATGFIHGDLRPGNVLATLADGRFRFTLIDNESNRLKIPPPGRMLLRNLMQLNMLPPSALSRTDRMRFFSAWRRQMRELTPIEAKIVGAEAYHWAMRRQYDKGRL